MKYFTPELLERVSSPDDDVADEADRDWERAIRAYNRRWRKIRAAFPKAVQRFNDDQICLHDALVLSLGRQNNSFVFVLQMEPPSQKLVILTFTLDGEPAIETAALPGCQSSGVVAWLYEEWDLDRDKQCWFEVLLSNGWSVKLKFGAGDRGQQIALFQPLQQQSDLCPLRLSFAFGGCHDLLPR